MKFKSLLLLFCLSVFVIACSDDDDDDDIPNNPLVCNPGGALESNIVGTWDINTCMGGAPVIIAADSTYQDPDDCLLGLDSTQIIERTYFVVGDTVTFSIRDTAGTSVSFDLGPPIENCADRISFEFFGFPIVFTRQ